LIAIYLRLFLIEMLFPIPQPEPPAQIQIRLPQAVSDLPRSSNLLIASEKTIPLKVINPSNSSPEALSDNTNNGQGRGQVIEFYYSNPKDIPSVTPRDNFLLKKASGLGSPISVDRAKLKPTYQITRLVTQDRLGREREFEFSLVLETPNNSPPGLPPVENIKVVEVLADRQEYNDKEQTITAKGKVVMHFGSAVMTTDSLRVNLKTRLAVAEGKVVLTRGEQILKGDRFEYYFVQDRGTILNAKGQVYQATASRDLTLDSTSQPVGPTLLPTQLDTNQPLQNVTSGGSYNLVLGSGENIDMPGAESEPGGQVNRFRFEAEKINFQGSTWEAINIRVTNDPFSPPELEVRADTAKLRNIAPQVDELVTTNSRIVLDQKTSLPLTKNRLVFDGRPRQPGLFTVKFDGEDRGGLYLERSFQLIDTDKISFNVTPQYLLEKALFPSAFGLSKGEETKVIAPSVFGLTSSFEANLSPRTSFIASESLASLDLNEVADNLRANVRLEQKIGALNAPHSLRIEYNYRERLFNGSLGYQTVQSSYGASFVSPVIPLGNSGVNFTYQSSIQNIQAETDKQDLLPQGQDEGLINLTRYESAASISRGFYLWQGDTLPATAQEGLRYTPTPVQPFLQLTTEITGVGGFYSNGDTQPYLKGSVGLRGQLGHFSRPYFDYTGFNFVYSQGIRGDESPFKFDRFVDKKTISLGWTQQIYGPLRAGVQTEFNLDNNDEITTDYFVEYSRRTYNFVLRYNPALAIGSFSFQINDFNWIGDSEPFDGNGTK
jgi:lipopolysaccharide export system protein LptA